MNGLKDILAKYSQITMDIEKCLINETYDSLNFLLHKRQLLIEDANNISYSKEEFREICNEFGLSELEEKVNGLIKEKRAGLRSEINKFSINKGAIQSYSRKSYANPKYFNKKL